MTLAHAPATAQHDSFVAKARAWQQEVQFKTEHYEPLLGPDDKPATYLNADLMAKLRPAMEPQYFDPKKYRSYLQQLGIDYEKAGAVAGK